jgi:hypothetical protein
MLFGLFIALLVLFAPLNGRPKWAARAWNIEEIPLDWLASLLPKVFGPSTGSGMLLAVVLHFGFWLLLGGLIFWGAAILRARVSHDG